MGGPFFRDPVLRGVTIDIPAMLGVGDPAHDRLVRRVWEGAEILVSSHHLDEVSQIADRVLLMNAAIRVEALKHARAAGRDHRSSGRRQPGSDSQARHHRNTGSGRPAHQRRAEHRRERSPQFWLCGLMYVRPRGVRRERFGRAVAANLNCSESPRIPSRVTWLWCSANWESRGARNSTRSSPHRNRCVHRATIAYRTTDPNRRPTLGWETSDGRITRS